MEWAVLEHFRITPSVFYALHATSLFILFNVLTFTHVHCVCFSFWTQGDSQYELLAIPPYDVKKRKEKSLEVIFAHRRYGLSPSAKELYSECLKHFSLTLFYLLVSWKAILKNFIFSFFLEKITQDPCCSLLKMWCSELTCLPRKCSSYVPLMKIHAKLFPSKSKKY